MSQYKFTILAQCLPDYFGGHHKPVIQIAVWKDLSKLSLIEMIVDEYHMLWEHLHYEDAWPDLDDTELRTMADEFITSPFPFAQCDIPTLEEHHECEDDDCVQIFITCEEV